MPAAATLDTADQNPVECAPTAVVTCLHSATSPASVASDSPPSRRASCACRIAASVRSRSTLPPSDSMSHLTLAATSSAATMPSSLSYPSTATASRISSSKNTRFILCSA
nr:unnamed protein product [Digitaria exilis]